MEMNTRIQVEHTVTELVTGLDLVREQVLVAAGEPLSVAAGGRRDSAGTRSSAGSTPRTSSRASCPRPGRITAYEEPAGPGVRVDSGVRGRRRDLGLYDPMIAKLIVHDVDRETREPTDAPCARRVPDRGAADAARLPPALLEQPLLRRRRDVPRPRRVGGARAARGGAEQIVLSSDNKCDGRRGRRRQTRERARRGRGRRPRVRRAPPHDRAAVGGARRVDAASGRAGGGDVAGTAPCSARCRARCSRSLVADGDTVEAGRCSASSRR